MDFGEKIKKLREEKGFTQKQMAEILGISKSNISKYEANSVEPNIGTLRSYSSFFDVSLDYLLGKSNNKTDSPPMTCYMCNAKHHSIKYWIEKTGLGKDELAKRLGITQDLMEDYMSGTIAPPYNILISLSDICEVSTDCLIGIHEGSRATDMDNILPFRYNYRIAERIRALCDKKNVSPEYLRDLLSLSENEVYYLIEYGFVPHMSTITKLANFFDVSCDYLLCQIEDQDEKAAMAFRLLNEDNKDIIIGEIKKALREQKLEGTVAADTPLKKTGTDNLGK